MMLTRLARIILAAMLVLPAAAPSAAATRIATDGIAAEDVSLTWTETVVVEDDDGYVVEDADAKGTDDAAERTHRYAAPATDGYGPSRPPLYAAGPFYVVSPDTVEMIGTVDSDSPALFARLRARFPGLSRLVMVECPGSVDEDANRRLARAVRAAGMVTVVPRGGSVRSGAVDLFLAGVERFAASDAEFGVHAWQDEDGLGPADFAADDPVNAGYVAYYREMGMDAAAARRFYALTNSASFDAMRTLSARDMAQLGLARISG